MAELKKTNNDASRDSGEIVNESVKTLVSKADVQAVYGTPFEIGDTLVIPAAEIISAVGFGFGSGDFETEPNLEKDTDSENQMPASGTGGGGGGGGYSFSRPVAMIVVNQNGVHVQQVVDMTKITLAAISAFGFMAATIAGFFRSRR